MITLDIQQQRERTAIDTAPVREVVRNRPKVRELAFALGCELDAVVDGLLDAAAKMASAGAGLARSVTEQASTDVYVRDQRAPTAPTIFAIAGRLTRPERLVLYLHLQEELTEPEIAERLRLPVESVTEIIDEAFARLRARTNEFALNSAVPAILTVCGVRKL